MPAGIEPIAPEIVARDAGNTSRYFSRSTHGEHATGKYSQTRLAAVVEQASDAVLIADTAGRIEYVNPAFERITGYMLDEVIGRDARIFSGREADQALFENMWDTIKSGIVWKGALASKRKDDTPYQVEMAVSPVFNSSERIVGYSALMRDITQEMELESRLRQAEKMEAVGQLASGVAHDFNNILTAILGHVSLLRTGMHSAPTSLDALADGLDHIEHAARQGAALTRQLLNFNRKRPTHLEPIRPNDVLSDTQRMLQRLIAQNISLNLHLSPAVGAVMADVCQLEQIILNLALNARDAMPEGGVLTISTEMVDLDDEYAASHHDAGTGPHVLIRVRDTGAGMSPDVLGHIFEPFYTTKSPGKGTGLGLATVYGIVQRFGGHIGISSRVGEGSEFRVYLPATVSANRDEPRTDSPDDQPHGSETILVCEDDEVIRELECEILETHGYRVLSVSDCDQALELAGKVGIDLLITDIMMPGVGGQTLANEFVAARPGVKVLFVTGYLDAPGLVRRKRGKRTRVLPKPFTTVDLLVRVREILDQSEGT